MIDLGKVKEALDYVTKLWNMQEQDIRGKRVLDVNALRMTNEKQQLFAEASEQLDEALAELEKPAEDDVYKVRDSVLEGCVSGAYVDLDYDKALLLIQQYAESYHAKKCKEYKQEKTCEGCAYFKTYKNCEYPSDPTARMPCKNWQSYSEEPR